MLRAIIFNIGALLVIFGLGVPFLGGDLFGYSKKINNRVQEAKQKMRNSLPLTLDEENEIKAVDTGTTIRRWGLFASIVGAFFLIISLI